MAGKSVTVRFVRSDGKEFEIGTGTPWRIPNDGLENLANLEYSVETSANVLTDGSSFVSSRVEEVDRTFTADYWGVDPDTARADAVSFFNHRFTFEAHISYRGRERWCEGRLYGFESEAANVYDIPSISITLLCLDPYMRSESDHSESFGDSKPMFGFPFVSIAMPEVEGEPPAFGRSGGFICSVSIYDGKNTIVNSGDVPTMYRVRIVGDDDLVNPTITKDGKCVKLSTTLKAGQVAIIDFESAPPRVTIDGENAIQKCTRGSSFTDMAMQVGENIFTFSVDNEENMPLADVSVIYTDKYLGV